MVAISTDYSETNRDDILELVDSFNPFMGKSIHLRIRENYRKELLIK